jgi:fructose/tagatose bisphosphate aldolase
VDWLSVAVGSIHGAISDEFKHEPKVQARLNIEHLQQIHQVTGIPLVLHGGSGIPRPLIMESIRHGIAKINIGTAIRQPYERLMATSIEAAQEAVYEAMVHIIREDLGIAHSASALCEGSAA